MSSSEEEDDLRRNCRLVAVVMGSKVVANILHTRDGTQYEFDDTSIPAGRVSNPEEVASSLSGLCSDRDVRPDGLVVVADRPAHGDAAPEVQAIDSLDIGLPVTQASLFDSEIRALPDVVLADDAWLGKNSGVPSSLMLPWVKELGDAEFCLYVGQTWHGSSRVAWVSLRRLDVRPVEIDLPSPDEFSETWARQAGETLRGLLADPPGSVRAVLLGADLADRMGERAVKELPHFIVLQGRRQILSQGLLMVRQLFAVAFGNRAPWLLLPTGARIPVRPMRSHMAMMGALMPQE